jgi:hypothetical protein
VNLIPFDKGTVILIVLDTAVTHHTWGRIMKSVHLWDTIMDHDYHALFLVSYTLMQSLTRIVC